MSMPNNLPIIMLDFILSPNRRPALNDVLDYIIVWGVVFTNCGALLGLTASGTDCEAIICGTNIWSRTGTGGASRWSTAHRAHSDRGWRRTSPVARHSGQSAQIRRPGAA